MGETGTFSVDCHVVMLMRQPPYTGGSARPILAVTILCRADDCQITSACALLDGTLKSIAVVGTGGTARFGNFTAQPEPCRRILSQHGRKRGQQCCPTFARLHGRVTEPC